MNAHALRRLLPLLVGVVILIGATAIVVVRPPVPFVTGGGSTADASDLNEQPAPDFHLTDSNGNLVSMTQMKGKAVALTFIYTSCPDVCPLITANFAQAFHQVGPDTARVRLVAITVDPETDTPQRVSEYSQAMGMVGKWEFLTGTRDELQPVWSSYWVAPIPVDQADQLAAEGLAVGQADQTFQGLHTAPVFLIDAQGRERRLLDPTFSPQELVSGLRALL